MAPPTALADIVTTSSMDDDFGIADYTPDLAGGKQNIEKKMFIPANLTPKFTDKYKEREYQKGRLALAFRIFAKYGFDEGVAGHITLRVSFRGGKPILGRFVFFDNADTVGRILSRLHPSGSTRLDCPGRECELRT